MPSILSDIFTYLSILFFSLVHLDNSKTYIKHFFLGKALPVSPLAFSSPEGQASCLIVLDPGWTKCGGGTQWIFVERQPWKDWSLVPDPWVCLCSYLFWYSDLLFFSLTPWNTDSFMINSFFGSIQSNLYYVACNYRLLNDAIIYCFYNVKNVFYNGDRNRFQLFFRELFLSKVRIFTFTYYGKAEIWRGLSIMKWEHEKQKTSGQDSVAKCTQGMTHYRPFWRIHFI